MSKNDWLSIDWSIYCERTEDLYNHSNHSVLVYLWDENDSHLFILHVKCSLFFDQLNDSEKDRLESKLVQWQISVYYERKKIIINSFENIIHKSSDQYENHSSLRYCIIIRRFQWVLLVYSIILWMRKYSTRLRIKQYVEIRFVS
jgi:hypothetical protein